MGWSTKWEDVPVSDIDELNKIYEDWSNPNLILTFECAECGQEFDCNTTKFGVLCDKAAIAGWKMKFKEIGYDCYCPKHKE